MKNLKFFEAVALLIGTIMGAGYLGIPYVVSRVGFLIGSVIIIGLGLLLMLQYLAIAEVSLRTTARHQIAGYVSKYLGRRWRLAIDFLIVLEAYGVLLAYAIGEGEVLSQVFGLSPRLLSLLFFAVVAAVIYVGLRLVEKAELLLTFLSGSVIIIIALVALPTFRFENLNAFGEFALLPAYGVILFSFLGGAAVPEMRQILRGQEPLLRPAIIVGTLVPIGIYLLFTLAVLGVTGTATTPIATVGLGNALGPGMRVAGNLLAATTMTTAFLALGLVLKDSFRFDMRFRKSHAFLLTIGGPLALLLIGLTDFIEILLIVGAVFGGLQGFILVRTWWRARLSGDRHPEIQFAHPRFYGIILSAVFLIGVIYTLLDIGGHL